MPDIKKSEFRPLGPPVPGALPPPIPGDIRRLVSLFPNAKPAYIPLRVKPAFGSDDVYEKTSALFVAPDAVIFRSDTPHRNGEALLLRHVASSDEYPATVVAVIYDETRMAVAVHFLDGLPKWLQTAERPADLRK
jgi:hypothetical protein